MRQKTNKLVIAFHTTTEALHAEQICGEEDLPGRMIPVPRQISAGCGMAWMCPPEEKEHILEVLRRRGVEIEQHQEVML